MNESQDHAEHAPVADRRTRPSTSPARRRLVLVLVAAVVVLLGVGIGVTMALRSGDAGPLPAPDPVVLPVPTPTVAPAERDRSTEFQRALPDAVLSFAVAGQATAGDLYDGGAVEAYDLTYTDGAQDVLLRASQWRGAPAAAEAMAAAVASAPAPPEGTTAPPPLRDEPVLVAGAEVGRVLITSDGTTARATWTNGSTLFQVDGPAAVVVAFYDAFPM